MPTTAEPEVPKDTASLEKSALAFFQFQQRPLCWDSAAESGCVGLPKGWCLVPMKRERAQVRDVRERRFEAFFL